MNDVDSSHMLSVICASNSFSLDNNFEEKKDSFRYCDNNQNSILASDIENENVNNTD